MSTALVRKSLAIVDTASNDQKSKKSKRKQVLPIPEKFQQIKSNGDNPRSHKLNIVDIRKKQKSKSEILNENLKKLKLIKEICTIEIDREATHKLIERAVTRRPIKSKPKTKKSQKTAFTEEDFKKFEEEYFDE